MLYLYVFVLFSAAYAQDAIVNTTQGQVQGALATDGNYYVFYGVHYAGSSSGANRFKVMPMERIKIRNNCFCSRFTMFLQCSFSVYLTNRF